MKKTRKEEKARVKERPSAVLYAPREEEEPYVNVCHACELQKFTQKKKDRNWFI